MRGNLDFSSIEQYQVFIDGVVNQHNRRNAKAVAIEREALKALPKYKAVDYTEVVAHVTCASTIDVRRVTYTVPSQLQGETLRIHLYDERLIAFLGRREVCELQRVYAKGNKRGRQIDYRHVIHSLMKKPQAFRWSRLREDLLPTEVYRKIWCYIDQHLDARQACRLMVGLLYLAYEYDCEKLLGERVLKDMSCSRLLSLSSYQTQFRTKSTVSPSLTIQPSARVKQL